MAKYKIDNQEYEVDTAVKSYLEAQQAKLDTAATKVAEHDKLQGKYDALETELEQKKQELEEAKAVSDKLDEKVEERLELVTSATQILGDSFDFKGKTDRDIKEAVIQTAKEDFKGDGKSDDYVNAFYDAMVGQIEAEGFHSDGANNLKNLQGAAGNKKAIEQKRADRMNMKNMNKNK
jgi:hypothetical protein